MPSRADCIVRVDVENGRQLSPDGTLAAWFPGIVLTFASRGLAGASWHGDAMYLQFSHQCTRRHQFATEILDHYRARVPRFPAAKVSRDTVMPSTATIDLRGNAWRD